MAELAVRTLDLEGEVVGDVLAPHRNVLEHLGKTLQNRDRLGERSPLERGAQQKSRYEAVACDVAVQPDQVPGLLAAELAALAVQRFEDVAVADVRRDDADAVVGHERVEAEIRHRRDRHEVDSEMERQNGKDLVTVYRLA